MNTPFEELMHTFCADNDARIKSYIYVYRLYQIDNLTLILINVINNNSLFVDIEF